MPNGARSAQITTSPIEAGSTGNVCARSWMVQQRAALSSHVMPCRVWFPSNPFVGFRPRSAALKPTSPPNVAPGIPPPAPSIPSHPSTFAPAPSILVAFPPRSVSAPRDLPVTSSGVSSSRVSFTQSRPSIVTGISQ
ncbi:unnamed protein product, partial [Closterium sp. NIES-65]